jgi:hypothetical protein
MKLLAIGLLAAAALNAQITATASAVTAQAGNTGGSNVLVCQVTSGGATCTVAGKPYAVWTAALVNGADAGDTVSWNGNVIGIGLHMANNVVSWSVSTQAAGGTIVRQTGTFSSGLQASLANLIPCAAPDAGGMALDPRGIAVVMFPWSQAAPAVRTCYGYPYLMAAGQLGGRWESQCHTAAMPAGMCQIQ